jgi:hypothetical protein
MTWRPNAAFAEFGAEGHDVQDRPAEAVEPRDLQRVAVGLGLYVQLFSLSSRSPVLLTPQISTPGARRDA